MKIGVTATARRDVIAIGIGVVAVAAVGFLTLGVGPVAQPANPPPVADAPAEVAAGPELPPGFVEFRSQQPGFALAYPADWTRLDSGDPAIPLVAMQGARSFQVRLQELPTEVGIKELPAARPLTDKIVLSDPSVKPLTQPKQINLGGLPGYFYFYSFKDPATGATGAHSHFFLFKGKTMIVLVFQGLPADQFVAGAATFDQITQSFRSN